MKKIAISDKNEMIEVVAKTLEPAPWNSSTGTDEVVEEVDEVA